MPEPKKRLTKADWRVIRTGLHYAAEWELSLAEANAGERTPDGREAIKRADEYTRLYKRLITEGRG